MSDLTKAKQWHDKAQQSGDPNDYETAAHYYDLAGKFTQALACRESADRLREGARPLLKIVTRTNTTKGEVTLIFNDDADN